MFKDYELRKRFNELLGKLGFYMRRRPGETLGDILLAPSSGILRDIVNVLEKRIIALEAEVEKLKKPPKKCPKCKQEIKDEK